MKGRQWCMKHLIHCLGMSVPRAKVPVAVQLQLTCTLYDSKLWQLSRDKEVKENRRQSHFFKNFTESVPVYDMVIIEPNRRVRTEKSSLKVTVIKVNRVEVLKDLRIQTKRRGDH